MSRLRLLPGEKELVRLRPTPAAWLGRYFLALLWLAWGLQWFTAWGIGMPGAVPDLAWTAVAIVGPLALVALLYGLQHRWVRFGLGAAGALTGLAEPLGASNAIAILVVLVVTAIALLLTEIDRRMRSYHLTNLRMLHNGGLWDRTGWTVHYDAVLDVDARQSPIGRLFGYGQLDPVLQVPKTIAAPTKRRKIAVPSMSNIDLSAPPRMNGVGPFRRVRHLVACFIQDATATPYLKAEQDTGRRVMDAIRALGSANVLRR